MRGRPRQARARSPQIRRVKHGAIAGLSASQQVFDAVKSRGMAQARLTHRPLVLPLGSVRLPNAENDVVVNHARVVDAAGDQNAGGFLVLGGWDELGNLPRQPLPAHTS